MCVICFCVEFLFVAFFLSGDATVQITMPCDMGKVNVTVQVTIPFDMGSSETSPFTPITLEHTA